MTKRELDSLTVVRDKSGRVELVNSSGHVAYFKDRDAAYDRVRELRRQGAIGTRRNRLYMAERSMARTKARKR